MFEGGLSFNVHEECFGMVEEEMVVQIGHTQAAFQRDEHREVTSSSNRTVSPMTMASLWMALVKNARVVSPMKAGIFQPSTETAMSSRGKLIL